MTIRDKSEMEAGRPQIDLTGDDGIEPFYEAFTLARVCRYKFEYWV